MNELINYFINQVTYFLCVVECEVGYTGTNCSLPCPFNSYGKGCQKLCKCTKEACNFITGCGKIEFGNCLTLFTFFCLNIDESISFSDEIYIVGNETVMEKSETTRKEITKLSFRNLLKYILIALSSLLGFVSIMYVWLLLYQKKVHCIW